MPLIISGTNEISFENAFRLRNTDKTRDPIAIDKIETSVGIYRLVF